MKLFQNLENLKNLSEAFYSTDQDIEVNSKTYTVRSFTYRLASYTEFSLPNAIDSRGTAYYSEKDKNEWKLFTRAYPKFWNLGEGVDTITYLKDNQVKECYEKLDGSLILVGSIDGKLVTKSKISLNSDQAAIAQTLLNESAKLQEFCNTQINSGFTPVFELVGPSNVIVLRYNSDALVLLGCVNNVTGEVKTFKDLNILTAKTYYYSWDDLLHIQTTSSPNIEGFVVKSEKGLCKVKVASYVALHKLKDNVNNIKALTELIIDDNLDDLMGSFKDDQKTIDYIVEVQEKISKKYNHLINTCEKIYNETKNLERKEYAILNKEKEFFVLLMALYLGRTPDYKTFYMKNYL